MEKDKEKVKDALLKRATGYDYEEKEIIADQNGRPQRVKVLKKHVPPDVAAIKEIMKEMNRGKW